MLPVTGISSELKYPSEEVSQKRIFGHPKVMKETLKKYLEYINKESGDYKGDWEIGELSFYLAEYYMFKHKIKEAEKFLEIGVKYSKKAIKTNPNGIEAGYWMIANLSIYSDIKGPSKMITEVLLEAKKTMKKLSVLDKSMKYMNGGWGRYLGRFYISLPPPPINMGDIEKGMQILQNVCKNYPNLSNF